MTLVHRSVRLVVIGGIVACLLGIAPAVGLGDGSPFGSLDRVAIEVGARSVIVQGWAIDPDTASPIEIHIYVNGRLMSGARADQARDDVGRVYPDFGAGHGYSVSVPANAGDNQVCSYGINAGAGTNSLIGCRTITVDDSPFGAFDRADVAGTGQSALVQGWAIDPQSSDPIAVHVYVNGTLAAGGMADRSRTDVGATFREFGDGHGYTVDVALRAGISVVCVYGINVGPGTNSLIGCLQVAVAGTNGKEGVLPGALMVAHYGSAFDPRLGVLGTLSPSDSAAAVQRRAREWVGFGLPVVPAFDYIASVATAAPGPDGDYSSPSDLDTLRTWLAGVRSVGGVLMLDIQPGRTDFLTEVRRYEPLLLEPDVGLALDPEWRMGPGEVPGQVIGSVGADEINTVTRYVADLVRTHDLPRKPVMIHQFTPFMVRDRDQLEAPPQLALTIQLDGFGTPEAKIAKYRELHGNPPFASGFKLFLTEDTRLMTPAEVMAFDPRPSFISYQ